MTHVRAAINGNLWLWVWTSPPRQVVLRQCWIRQWATMAKSVPRRRGVLLWDAITWADGVPWVTRRYLTGSKFVIGTHGSGRAGSAAAAPPGPSVAAHD